jgi:hypothetical protein
LANCQLFGLTRVARIASPFPRGRVRVARCASCVCENSNPSPQSSALSKGRGGTTAVELTANENYLTRRKPRCPLAMRGELLRTWRATEIVLLLVVVPVSKHAANREGEQG